MPPPPLYPELNMLPTTKHQQQAKFFVIFHELCSLFQYFSKMFLQERRSPTKSQIVLLGTKSQIVLHSPLNINKKIVSYLRLRRYRN